MKRENDPSAPSTALFNWYPGHMARALREIKQKLKLVDIVLEIRDARVPLATGNRALDEELGQKCKLIVLNKANLADVALMAQWTQWFEAQGEPFLFVNGLDKGAMKHVLGRARQIVTANRRASNPNYVETKTKIKAMIVGLPNTGKSTIINSLTNKNNMKVADKPGQTRVQQLIEAGDVHLLDTPGIMPPQMLNEQQGLWLSAINAIPDDVADEQDTAVFLVKHLLAAGTKEFVEKYQLTSPSLAVDEALLHIAKLRGCIRQQGLPDLDRVHKLILLDFRRGELGRTCFGVPPQR
jgi:ribosome biogenesis GTPase A